MHLELGVALVLTMAEEAILIASIGEEIILLVIIIIRIHLFDQILLVCPRYHIPTFKQATLSFRLVRSTHRAVSKFTRCALVGALDLLMIAAFLLDGNYLGDLRLRSWYNHLLF